MYRFADLVWSSDSLLHVSDITEHLTDFVEHIVFECNGSESAAAKRVLVSNRQ